MAQSPAGATTTIELRGDEADGRPLFGGEFGALIGAQAVASALEDAANAGITSAVVLSSGFAEAGADGEKLQRELVETAQRRGVTFFGPNSMGFANIGHHSAMTSINTRLPVRVGRLALISQSGAVAAGW